MTNQKSSSLIRICDIVFRYCFYAIMFLIPVFFLPTVAETLDFNKQFALIVLGTICLFSWMIKAMTEGEVSLNITKAHIFIGLFFLIYLLSTLFSVNSKGSFWGWPQSSSQNMATMIGFFIVYFLVSNVLSKKEIYFSIILLAISALVAELFGLLQIFGLFIFPFNFAKTIAFNSIGSMSSFGFFSALCIPLAFSLLIFSDKKSTKIFSGVLIAASLFILIIINYVSLWWITVTASIFLIAIAAFKKENTLAMRLIGLPMIILAIALLFAVLRPQIGWLPKGVNELILSQKSSLQIAGSSLKDNPIFGSGPGTFGYDFAKYKEVGFNKTVLWNVNFVNAGSEFLTNLTTIGLLGIVSIISLIGFLIFYFFNFIIDHKSEKSILTLGMFIVFLTATVGMFLQSFNLTLYFIYFFSIAAFVGFSSLERRVYIFKPSSLATLVITFAFTVVFIFGFGLLVLGSQRYLGETAYYQGLSALSRGNLDDGIKKIEYAATINSSSDLYFRQLSQLYVTKINNVAKNKDLSDEDRNKKINELINNSVNAGKIATDLNKNNVDNWAARGLVYQSLIGLINDTENWATKSYDEAIKLNPTNPYLFLQKGMVSMQQIVTLGSDKKTEKLTLISLAKEQFHKAIDLKGDYVLPRFQLAVALNAEGNSGDAFKVMDEAKKIAPNDSGLAFQSGLFYFQNKDYTKAQAELERAITLTPNYSNALYFLGLTYSKTSQKDKAIEMFTKLTELNPDSADLKKILENVKNGKDPLDGLSKANPTETSNQQNTETPVSPTGQKDAGAVIDSQVQQNNTDQKTQSTKPAASQTTEKPTQ